MTAPAGAPKMRLAHFSDTHEEGTPEGWRAFLDKRLLGALNYRLMRRGRHNSALLDRVVELILSEPPDAVICTGDLCSCGQPGEFKKALSRLKPLLESPIPFLYVPGNHDAYVRDAACKRALEDAFLALSKGRFKLGDLPAALDIGPCRFILADCARPTAAMLSCGFMAKETAEFVKRECAAPKSGPRIIVGHFPLLERHPIRRIRHRLYGAGEVAALLKAGEIDLSLCGHVHAPYALLDSRGRGEECAGSLTRYGSLSLIDYDKEKDVFSQRRISLP